MLLQLLRKITCISELKGDEIRECLLPLFAECLHIRKTKITFKLVKYHYHV